MPAPCFQVKWNRSKNDPSKAIPLEKLKLPDGHWQHSEWFTAVSACHEWGIRPSAFGICEPWEDLEVMIAYLGTKSRMAAYDDQVSADELKHKTNKPQPRTHIR